MQLPASTLYFRPGLAQNPFGRVFSGSVHIDEKGTGASKIRQLGWYQLVLILKGEGFYRDLQGNGFPLKRGDLLITIPDVPHQYGPSKGLAWSKLVILFNGPLFDTLQKSGWLNSQRHPIALTPISKWYRKFCSLLHLKTNEALNPLDYLHRFLTVLSELPLEIQKFASEEKPAWVTTALALIEAADPRLPLDVQKIAQKCNLGYSVFRHQFAAIVGQGPSAYHRKLRIQNASELIAYGNEPFKQIAQQLGYCDVFHFIKDFKEKTGLSPGHFRRELTARNIKVVDTAQVQKLALQNWFKAEDEKRRLEEKNAADRRRDWRLVFEDDFLNTNVLAHWEISGKWEIQDRELRIQGEQLLCAKLKMPVPGDVRLVFDCRLASEHLSDVSCFLSATDSSETNIPHHDGYLFQYGGWGNKKNILSAHGNNLWNQPGAPLAPDRLFHVEAQKIGNRLLLHVDGETIIDVRDPAPVFGADHAFLGLYSWGTTACFSNIRVYTRDAAAQADLLDTADDFFTRGKFIAARDLYQEVSLSSRDEKRTKHAECGLARAVRRIQLTAELPAIKARLLKIWPRAKIDLGSQGLTLHINQLGIKDLSPLQGLPLSELSCDNNQITSLEPLRGAPLNRLSCYQNLIRSLDPVQGMNLASLRCSDNQIASLEPLRGMNISRLYCSNNQITNLGPLQNTGLVYLVISHNQIHSLEPLRDLKLGSLECEGNQLTDLGPLRNMELSELSCAENQVTDLAPLRGMPLETLNCASNQIRDLTPLHGMNLGNFICNDNQIANLAPLLGMKLTVLFCDDNPIQSLEPLFDHFPHWMRATMDNLSQNERQLIKDRIGDKAFEALLRNAEMIQHWKRRQFNPIKTLAHVWKSRRYAMIPMESTWDEAKMMAEQMGGHLVVIHNQQENELVNAMAGPTGGAWIGLSYENGKRTWVTGEKNSYHQAEPKQVSDGGYRIMPSGAWSITLPRQTTYAFCVEWAAHECISRKT